MHELSLLTSVVAAVEKAAAAIEVTRINTVCLQVGTMSGAIPEALRDAWPLAIAGTSLAGATLELVVVPAAVWCPTCQREREIDEFFALACPVCDTPTANLVRGREFEIDWVDWDIKGEIPDATMP